MACGLPVVGSAVGGIKMTVADGETGYLVPPRDPLALADRLAMLIAHPQLRQTLGANGRRRVQRLFTWERVGAAIERLYHDVIETKTAAWTSAIHRGAPLPTG